MPDLDPDLQLRLKDLADARVRSEIARAAEAKRAAEEQRAAQARRRSWGVNARNTAKAARLRLTERHQLPPGNRPAVSTTKETSAMSETITDDFTKTDGSTYTDMFGEPMWIRAKRNIADGEGRISIEDPNEDSDTLWSFTTDEARQIAATLIHAADYADKQCQLIAATRPLAVAPEAEECRECHLDGDYSCGTCFPGGEAPQFLDCPVHHDQVTDDIGACTCAATS